MNEIKACMRKMLGQSFEVVHSFTELGSVPVNNSLVAMDDLSRLCKASGHKLDL